TDTDDTFQSAYAKLRTLLYEDSGYRRPSLGFERVIRQATPQDLRKFYSAYYVPNNIVLSIAGDVTVEHALDRAEKAFAGVAPGRLPVQRGMPDEKLERSRFHASEADINAAYLLMGWLVPGMPSADYPALAVAANALGGGKGSLMFRELRQKRGMAYDLGVLYPRLQYQSHLLAYVITDPYKEVLPGVRGPLALDDLKKVLLQQVELLKEKPLSAADLQRAKGYTIGTYALSQQRLMDRAFLLAWLEAIGVGYEAARAFPDQVEKVTAEDVQRVARKYLNNYAAVILIPKTTSPPAAQ
ncbi:MAG: M16 family metallopeptidase, partial [Armatimonadota bacterium]